MKGRNLLKKNEFYITVIIIVLACIIQVISGQFFTSNNLVDLLRSMICLWSSYPETSMFLSRIQQCSVCLR